MDIGIIGAGASGMMAALAAAQTPGVRVILFERQARPGRKLQATGNGRCNLTNLGARAGNYHGSDPAFVEPALTGMDPEKTLGYFRSLGLFTVAEESGKVYPYSDQANSVVDVLRFALQKPNVETVYGFEVTKVRREETGFLLSNGTEDYRCQKVIVACGGLAGSKLGGSMSGYKLLGKLGHTITRLRPSLVQLRSSFPAMAALKGVRANCAARIYKDGNLYSESTGEIQFTEYGVSGPVIFEISRDVCAQPGQWQCVLDLIPHCTAQELDAELINRSRRDLSMDDLLTGIVHNRLGRVITKAAGVKGKEKTSQLSDNEREAVVRNLKAFTLELTEPMGMDCAQVTAGGAVTEQFNRETMESKLVPGLYACGEVLDIDGDCGGYNLQWAWSSGFLAGKSAGKEVV